MVEARTLTTVVSIGIAAVAVGWAIYATKHEESGGGNTYAHGRGGTKSENCQGADSASRFAFRHEDNIRCFLQGNIKSQLPRECRRSCEFRTMKRAASAIS